jgi:hypothetical protein
LDRHTPKFPHPGPGTDRSHRTIDQSTLPSVRKREEPNPKSPIPTQDRAAGSQPQKISAQPASRDKIPGCSYAAARLARGSEGRGSPRRPADGDLPSAETKGSTAPGRGAPATTSPGGRTPSHDNGGGVGVAVVRPKRKAKMPLATCARCCAAPVCAQKLCYSPKGPKGELAVAGDSVPSVPVHECDNNTHCTQYKYCILVIVSDRSRRFSSLSFRRPCEEEIW